MKRPGLAAWILIAMISGIISGLLIHHAGNDLWVARFTGAANIITEIFLLLIKMIIAPLVFSTLVSGIAKLGDSKAVGRIGARTMGWFICASLLSLTLGMLVMNAFHLGESLRLPLPDVSAADAIKASSLSLSNFVTHVFPRSIIESMANNEILQIVVFSIFFGIATSAAGEHGKIIVRMMDAIADVILRVTGYVMKFAPFAAFSAIAAILAQKGVGLLLVYGKFILIFYLSILLLWIMLITVCYLFIGKKVFRLLYAIKDVVLLAFSTASSESAFPKLILELERFGCPPRIVSFVLPLGYSFNLDGSMLYISFASLFIAQAYGMHLSFAEQATMLLVMMLTSKGVAGVPRASLVVIAGTLSMFHIPQQGLLLLLGIDQILDMGRTATNVVGNSLATAAVSQMESVLDK